MRQRVALGRNSTKRVTRATVDKKIQIWATPSSVKYYLHRTIGDEIRLSPTLIAPLFASRLLYDEHL